MYAIFGVIILALIFEYINGFHDTANAIATSISTKVLTPRQAVALAAFFNLAGALAGTAVATTIGNGLVDNQYVTVPTLLCALSGAIIWNLLTWWYGLPSSSSHGLIGGLCGAVLASAHGNFAAIRWYSINPSHPVLEGICPKVVIPMFISPLVGIVLGFCFMGLLILLLRNWMPRTVNALFGKAQLLSASWMSFSHGTNDAQKTMGLMALTLFTATKSGAFANLPPSLHFIKIHHFTIPIWVKVICAITIACGTAAGGWRIIKTIGQKMVRLQPIHGFAAQTTAATVIQVATFLGIPLSTTHVISASIMGAGASKRFSAVKWGIVRQMVLAWLLTLPITGLLGYLFLRAVQWVGLTP